MKRRDLLKLGALATLAPTTVLATKSKPTPIKMVGTVQAQHGCLVCGPNLGPRVCGGYNRHEVDYYIDELVKFPIEMSLTVTYNEPFQETYAAFVDSDEEKASELLCRITTMSPEELFAGAYLDEALSQNCFKTYSLLIHGHKFRLARVSFGYPENIS